MNAKVLRITILLFSSLLGGCSTPIDREIVEFRKKLLLQSEPANIVSLTEAKTALVEEGDVVLVGRIGSGALSAFEKGMATFVLSEAPEDHGGDKNHVASECPFCRRKAEEAPLAQVAFQEENGKTIPVGADTLFDIEQGQIVVVQGRGHYDKDTDTLMIRGTSLFVRN